MGMVAGASGVAYIAPEIQSSEVETEGHVLCYVCVYSELIKCCLWGGVLE